MKKIFPIGLIAVIVLVGIAVVLWSVYGGAGKDMPYVDLQTTYAKLKFPSIYADNLKHTEVSEDGAVAEVFSMVADDRELELFRIYFGATEKGSIEGYYRTGSGQIPVSVLIGNGNQVAALDEETTTQYFSMMDALNVVLASLYEDESFSKDEMGLQNDKMTQMKYWSLKLPEAISWEESTEGELYRADFYGEVASDRIKLYSICIGDAVNGNPLGTMEIDGKQKTVSVKIEGLTQADTMSETDRSIVYSMLDTINDVVQQIVSSEHFSPIDTE